MAHLFNGQKYVEFTMVNHLNVKKHFESRLEQSCQLIGNDLHSVQGNEELLMDANNFGLYFEGEHIILPTKLLEIESLSAVLNSESINNNFSPEQRQELTKLMPKGEELESFFNIKCLDGYTPLQKFQCQMKKGYFTQYREKEDEINRLLNKSKLRQIYVKMFNSITERKPGSVQRRGKWAVREEESEVESIENLSERGQLSENSDATETEEEHNIEEFEEYPNELYYRYDFTKIKVQEELLSLCDDRTEKRVNPLKNIITVKPRNSQWVENFRKQQYHRYTNPTKPWAYVCEDGRKVTVAPVAKKISVLAGKPRCHAMLKNERPACVTILTLARDAAARLPNGVGTRADICQLVKQSQYITQDLPEQKLSSTISGALDRLHYLPDACVKYDSQKKLWIYLHIDRSHEHPGWGDDGDEYIEKNSQKKKKGY